MQRIVSLVPSVTETLLAWGRTPVACTTFCEQKTIETVGGTKNPKLDKIVELKPDLVVVEREENRKEDCEAMRAKGSTVLDLHVKSLQGCEQEMGRLAEAVEYASREPCHLGEIVEAEFAKKAKRNALVLIWRKPWMAISGDTYGASMLENIGIHVQSLNDTETYPTIPDLSTVDPERILLPSEPFTFKEKHAREVRALCNVKEVRLLDGKDLFWWGHRTPLARDRLASLLSDLVR